MKRVSSIILINALILVMAVILTACSVGKCDGCREYTILTGRLTMRITEKTTKDFKYCDDCYSVIKGLQDETER